MYKHTYPPPCPSTNNVRLRLGGRAVAKTANVSPTGVGEGHKSFDKGGKFWVGKKIGHRWGCVAILGLLLTI